MHPTDTKTDPDWLEGQYNNRALVPAHQAHFDRWASHSARARQDLPCLLDLAYGFGPGETLDVFPAQGRKGGGLAPVMVFIHGGYWRSLDKADHSFVAAAFARRGVCVVVPNYALCPAVTIPDICLQMVRATAWVYRHIGVHGGDPRRIMVAGHSAGGHLAAMMLSARWQEVAADLPPSLLHSALSISGLFDLEPLRHTPFLSDSLRLTPEQVRLASPVGFAAPPLVPEGRGVRGALACVAGADESAEFLRQNGLLRQVWGDRAVPVCEALPGLNHFSVLEAFTDPRHRLHRLAMKWLLA
ncbi:MAG TPA: alpha/beta hydrolase [Hydrogenophaga sp.]|uniref:alpha/beta hydrolase n=1 Tax=Hydrogenophaga sp. TaxID=1904254 RepID=UPI002B7B9DFE|nr:alpha/beta hydrolase [Hydrogenophaga sp.]HMN93118.1 alpha/beta hydrolase [Hydrogenophaga sp.]HMP10924.1 alpha/beta hydrolase [Hydrogenophaga sp.]